MIICVDFKSRNELKNKNGNCKNNYEKYTIVHYFVNQVVGRIFFSSLEQVNKYNAK